jgi:chromosome segregation ATPase
LSLLLNTFRREDEVQPLQNTIERITAEKRELEASAAEQAETCRQLQEANDTLSARTLSLAEEAASSADNVKGQLVECQRALENAQEEIANLSTRNMTMMERQAEL